jgi:hypothetical protein
MLRKVVFGAGLALLATAFAAGSALAYTGTPGTTASTSTSTPPAGGSFTLTDHFTGGAGQVVNFSFTGGTGSLVQHATAGGAGFSYALMATTCTVTFTPNPGTTDSSGNVSTTVTLGSGCAGALNLTGTSGAQSVTTTVTVAGLPAASGQAPLNVPALWLGIFILGLLLVAGSVFGFRSRQQPASA